MSGWDPGGGGGGWSPVTDDTTPAGDAPADDTAPPAQEELRTADDGGVCSYCAGQAGVYEEGTAPALPLHMGCRCWVEPLGVA